MQFRRLGKVWLTGDEFYEADDDDDDDDFSTALGLDHIERHIS